MADLSPESTSILSSLPGLAGSAVVGWAARHFENVRKGRSRLLHKGLFLELPTVALCAVVGGGIAELMEWPPMTGWMMAGLLGHAGPSAMRGLLPRMFDGAGLGPENGR